jgi:hypothetical protein
MTAHQTPGCRIMVLPREGVQLLLRYSSYIGLIVAALLWAMLESWTDKISVWFMIGINLS